MLVEKKSALASRSVWGSIIALIPVVDQALVLTGVLPLPIIGEAVSLLVATFGSLLGLYGRIKATKKIG